MTAIRYNGKSEDVCAQASVVCRNLLSRNIIIAMFINSGKDTCPKQIGLYGPKRAILV